MKLRKRILFASAVVMLVWFCAAEADPNRKKDKYAIIDCWNGKFVTLGEANQYTNLVHEGKKLKWKVYGPENTIVKIEFAPDSTNFPNCHGTSPDDITVRQKTIDEDEQTEIDLKVKDDKGGIANGECYVYKIECNGERVEEEKPAAASSSAIDPIIEVPKKREN